MTVVVTLFDEVIVIFSTDYFNRKDVKTALNIDNSITVVCATNLYD